MWQLLFISSLLIDIINIPFDQGANKLGSRYAYSTLKNDLKFLPIGNEVIVNCNKNLKNLFKEGYLEISKSFERKNFPLCIGGDHSVAISTIFASNEYCLNNKKKLGVLWFDAHADFNTMKTSPSKNLHGMPIAILCGHEKNVAKYGNYLYTDQFGFYGIRDLDVLEFDRFQENNMLILDNEDQLDTWIKNFDVIHLSFDMDCLDPSNFSSVNTPVKNGPLLKNVNKMLDKVRSSNKLISMDLVEYNPTIKENNKVIVDILKRVVFEKQILEK